MNICVLHKSLQGKIIYFYMHNVQQTSKTRHKNLWPSVFYFLLIFDLYDLTTPFFRKKKTFKNFEYLNLKSFLALSLTLSLLADKVIQSITDAILYYIIY